jgi:hypothetical protein
MLVVQTALPFESMELIDEDNGSESPPVVCMRGDSCLSNSEGEQRVAFYADPERAKVRLLDADGEVLYEETVVPEYEREYPNGKECASCGKGTVSLGMP